MMTTLTRPRGVRFDQVYMFLAGRREVRHHKRDGIGIETTWLRT